MRKEARRSCEEFAVGIKLTKSQDQMADKVAEELAAEARELVDIRQPILCGLSEKQYNSFIQRIEEKATATFVYEVAKAWKELCHACFDDFLFENFIEMKDYVTELNRKASEMAHTKKAQKLERKLQGKKITLERKAIRHSKYKW